MTEIGTRGDGMGTGASVQKSGNAERSEFASYREDFHKVRRYITSYTCKIRRRVLSTCKQAVRCQCFLIAHQPEEGGYACWV